MCALHWIFSLFLFNYSFECQQFPLNPLSFTNQQTELFISDPILFDEWKIRLTKDKMNVWNEIKMSEAFHQLYVANNLPRELSSGPWISIYMQLRTRKENFREGTALRRVFNDLVWEALTWEARTNAKGKCLLWVDDAVLRLCYSGDGHTAQLRHIFQLEWRCSSAISPAKDVLFEAYSVEWI